MVATATAPAAEPWPSQDRLADAIDALVAFNKDHQAMARLHGLHKKIGPIDFARHFATVRVAVGRSTGISTYINSRFDASTDVLLVGQTLQAEERKRKTGGAVFSLATWQGKQCKLARRGDGSQLRRVYVDGFSQMGKVKQDDLYWPTVGSPYFSANPNLTYILLG
jgi:hypothetical protein